MRRFRAHRSGIETPCAASPLNFMAGWCAKTLILAVVLLACAGSAAAQVAVSWNGGNGAWLTASNWNPMVVPNNCCGNTYSVGITNGPSVVTLLNPNINLTLSVVLDDLTLAKGNALQIQAATLTLSSGTSSNAGALTAQFFSTFENAAGSTLNNSGFLGTDFSATIKNGGALNNSGTVEVDLGFTNLGGGNVTNTGFLLNIGILANNFAATIDNFGSFQNNAGAFIENHGTINLFSGMKNFGTIDNFGTINQSLNFATPLINGAGGTINNGGTVALAGGFHNSGAFNNSAMNVTTGLPVAGTFSVLNGGTFENDGSFVSSQSGPIGINGGGTFNNNLGGTMNVLSMDVAGTLNNSGMVSLNPQPLPPGGSPLSILAGGTFNNNAGGMVTIDPGPFNVPAVQINGGGIFNNNAGGTLNATGALVVGGTLNNAGMVMLNPQPLPPGGSPLSILAGGVLNNSGTLVSLDPGPVSINAGGTLNNPGMFDTMGPINVAGLLSNNGMVNMTGNSALSVMAGGTLGGTGTISGNVANAGMLMPGTGAMTINGNYTQTGTGVYLAGLGGLFAGQFSQLNISGSASLAGSLNVSLVNSFVVNLGDSFFIMTFNSLTGTFSSLNLPSLASGLQWLLAYNPTNITLSVGSSQVPQVPEPGTLLLVASGLSGLLWRRRRRC
jgi:hypothetical protein